MHGHINLRLRDANHNHPQKRLWKMVLKLKSLHGGPHRLQNDLVPTTTMHGHTNLVKHPGFLGCGFLSKAHQTHKKLGLGVGLPKAWRQPNITKKLGLGWQRIGRGFVVPTGCAQSSSSHSFLPSRDYSSESRPEVVRRVISADADQVNGGQIPLEVWFTGFLSQLASSKLLGFHHTSSSPSPAYVFYPTDWVELWHFDGMRVFLREEFIFLHLKAFVKFWEFTLKCLCLSMEIANSMIFPGLWYVGIHWFNALHWWVLVGLPLMVCGFLEEEFVPFIWRHSWSFEVLPWGLCTESVLSVHVKCKFNASLGVHCMWADIKF